jgi:signal peptidase
METMIMIKKVKKTANRIIMGALILVIAGLIFLAISPGFHLYLVRSESMKPSINIGDLIVTRAFNETEDSTIEPGTVVTYKHGKGLVTHRVMDVKTDRILTKGDAMEDPDPWKVTIKDVTDTYIFRIPMVGRFITMVGTKLGWLIAIILPSVVLVSLLIKDILKEAFSET